MPDVSLNFRQNAFYTEERGGIPICLITIDHPDFSMPIRISTDPTDRLTEHAQEIVYGTASRGNDYWFFPIKLKLPDDTENGPRNMSIQFDNVNRDYVEQIRAIKGPLTVNTDMVLSNALDYVEAMWPEFLLRNIKYNDLTINGTMHMETLENEAFPAGSFLPSTTPNLF